MTETYSCELCGKELKEEDEWGDVDGAIVCADCLGWYGTEPDPEVVAFYKKHEE